MGTGLYAIKCIACVPVVRWGWFYSNSPRPQSKAETIGVIALTFKIGALPCSSCNGFREEDAHGCLPYTSLTHSSSVVWSTSNSERG